PPTGADGSLDLIDCPPHTFCADNPTIPERLNAIHAALPEGHRLGTTLTLLWPEIPGGGDQERLF
ncbi:MAG: hypothetical protein ACREYF_12250, partial [Gammaproteobacteria bacterium]